ncbi:hypothetical protein OHA72_37645 [Dactylosporangium sp. NBC_01737]|uniref:hypothetical protein n=1 Tax=Dactylosporangium sp. NBC_01737 TaxID=2975959 RepID=UPI002E1677EC|nr:hypothetical protein OHA72_37645 [Dactylosporangium sp. NBC_01737]
MAAERPRPAQRADEGPRRAWLLPAANAALVVLLAVVITSVVDVHFDDDGFSLPWWLTPLVAGQLVVAAEPVRRLAGVWVWLLVVVLLGAGLVTPAEDDINSLTMLLSAALLAGAAVFVRPGRPVGRRGMNWVFGVGTAVSLIPMSVLAVMSRGGGGPGPVFAALVPTMLGIAAGLALVRLVETRRNAALARTA